MYGIDILLDEDFNPWVLEINSNPSFNMTIQKFEKVPCSNDFKIKTEVSEIDKHIKTLVLSDSFKVLTCGLDTVSELGSFERIFQLNNLGKDYEFVKVLEDIREVFEALCG
jgi:spore coat polysaccharide biosynthesis protein SpsF (cytidylyltransferase family)